jgi:pantothenate kinase
VAPRGIAITEGNYLTLDAPGWRRARARVDLLVFIDTDRDELLRRLVARQEAFGRDRVDAAHWVRTVDAANIDLVMAGRERADAVVMAR